MKIVVMLGLLLGIASMHASEQHNEPTEHELQQARQEIDEFNAKHGNSLLNAGKIPMPTSPEMIYAVALGKRIGQKTNFIKLDTVGTAPGALTGLLSSEMMQPEQPAMSVSQADVPMRTTICDNCIIL